MTEEPLHPQVIQQALMSAGFHRYFTTPQQAMEWGGTPLLVKTIIKNKELKDEDARLTAEVSRLMSAQPVGLPASPVQATPSAWDDVPPPSAPTTSPMAPQPSVAPAPQAIKRKGVTIQGVDPIEPPHKKSEHPYAPATTRRTGGVELPPSFALPEGANGSATKQENSSPNQQNPHFIGNMVPPAPDPQEFVLDLSASGQPSPNHSAPSLDLGVPPQPSMSPIPAPLPPQPLTTDQIPPEVLARMNSPFPTQHIQPSVSMPVNMSAGAGDMFDSILDIG